MALKSKVRNKILSGQSRELVSSLIKFMLREAKDEAPVIPFGKVDERIEAALGISQSTITRIKTEAKEVDKKIKRGEKSSFRSPDRNRAEQKSVIFLDDSYYELRKTIMTFHTRKKHMPTIKQVYKKFCANMGYKNIELLRREIYKLGYRTWTTKNHGKILIERHEIRHRRLQFLMRIKEYRKEGRPIVYMDGTCINPLCPKQDRDESNDSRKKGSTRGPQLVIVNAGGEDGFVPNAYVNWKSICILGNDYRNDMTFENYKTWVAEKLMPNLQPRSVIVIDNAPYHNKQIDKSPTSASRREVMLEWLQARNIPYEENMLTSDLYDIIKKHKPRCKVYELDQLFTENGHDVLRLPPYHKELNPIDLVWTAMKTYITSSNYTYNYESVKEHCEQFFKQFTVDEWRLRCEQTKKLENEYMESESLVDTVVDDLILKGPDEEYDSESANSESDEEMDSS